MGASTYDSSTLSSSTLFQVRHIIGDTNVTDPNVAPHFDDAEISYELTAAGDVPADAAIALLEVLAARYRQKANVTTGALSISMGALAAGFTDQADRLRSQSSTYGTLVAQDTIKNDGYSNDIESLEVDSCVDTSCGSCARCCC